MRIRLIVNPRAGRGRAERELPKLVLILSEKHLVHTHVTTAPRDAEEDAARLPAGAYDLVVVAGGDGTLHEVVNGLMAKPPAARPPIGYIPLGTSSVFAWEMGLPRDPEVATRELARSNVSSLTLIDLARVRLRRNGREEERYAVLMAGAGFDGAAVRAVGPRLKAIGGKLAYILSGLMTWLRLRTSPVRVELDGVPHGLATYAIAANARAYGGNLSLTPDANIKDGWLDVGLFHGRSRWAFAKLILSTLVGRPLATREYSTVRARKIGLFPQNGVSVPVQLDGEGGWELPGTVETVAGALRVLIPPPAAASPPLWKSFAPFDAVALVFLTTLLAINLLSRHAIPEWPLLAMEYGLLIILIPSLIHMAHTHRARGWHLAREFYLIPLTMLSFDSLGELVPYVNPHSYDADVATWDAAMFGGHPTIWLQRIVTPWITEVLQLAYASYYFLPIILMVRLSQAHRKQHPVFVEAATTLGLTFFLSYVGYFLLPVSGPRNYLAPLYTVPLTGVLLAGPIANTINALENIKWDCFPSGHTAVVLVVLSYVWRHAKPLLRYYLPVSVLLILATVYCRYHYVSDVLAGAALAGLCLWVGPRLCRGWARIVR